MVNIFRKALGRARNLIAVEGFAFGRPIVLLQSDDWGRVGVRSRECWDELRSQVPNLGERSYDFYSLETAEDVAETVSLFKRHRDSGGRSPCLEMNFIVANVDFAKVVADDFREIHMRSLTDGLPDGWERPGLFEGYREGIPSGILSPALHGASHFCRRAVQRRLADTGEQGIFLRKLWEAGVPYIHWRMPWAGFEYWDPESHGGQGFIPPVEQEEQVGLAANAFSKLFGRHSVSACAPGYRADRNTHKAWAKYGVRVAQNGAGGARLPHFDGNGILHLYRSLDFEPATDPNFSLASCLRRAEESLARGAPAIVSIHSINFHSALKDFRSRTLGLLDEFFTRLEAKHPDLLYLRDQDIYDLVETGIVSSGGRNERVPVTKRKFTPVSIASGRSA